MMRGIIRKLHVIRAIIQILSNFTIESLELDEELEIPYRERIVSFTRHENTELS